MIFTQHKVPRKNLLNRYGDVSLTGEYETEIKNNNKRFALHLGALSTGRHACSQLAVDSGMIATISALRYATT